MIYFLTDKADSCPKIAETSIVTNFKSIPVGSKVIMFSYGKIVSKKFLKMFDMYNIHNSLLPKYRGLHAFTWAMINGDNKVGYTFHKVDEGVDSGDIGSQVVIPIDSNDDINDLFTKSKSILNKWLEQVVTDLTKDKISFYKQNESEATYVTKRIAEDSKIDWNQTSLEIHNFIRALSPPYTSGAFSQFYNDKVFFISSSLNPMPSYKGIPGQVVANFGNKGVMVKTGDSALLIKKVCFNSKIQSADSIFKSTGLRLT